MKKILITGSTDGIGKLAATKLAKKGHGVYLHGRNADKLSAVISEIKELTKNENVKGFVADFSDFDSVTKMAQEVSNELSKLDVLINNAGIFNSPKSKNKDGLDMRFAVNYLAPYLLTNELISLLNNSEEPRIINLSSAAQAPVSYKALTGKLQKSENEAYAQSKLALTMWSFYLAQKSPNLSVIAVNPGSLLDTKMVKEAFGNSWSSPDKGANILFDLAVSKEYSGITGKYFDNDKGTFGNAHPNAYNEEEIKRLIQATESILLESADG